MVYESLEAAKLLELQGVSSTVVNMHTIKPLDTSVIDKAATSSRLIITIEEHSVIGGLGGAVAEYKSASNAPPQLIIGLPDSAAGEYRYMLEKGRLRWHKGNNNRRSCTDGQPVNKYFFSKNKS